MSPTDVLPLLVTRGYAAAPEAVFDAWTSPEVLRRWWANTPAGSTPEVDVDLRVGGRYRLTMIDGDGVARTVGGEYRAVQRPARLVYTWSWEDPDGRSGPESVVTVDFRPDGAGTTVVIEHAGLATAESVDGHRAGWNGTLDNLGRRVLKTPS